MRLSRQRQLIALLLLAVWLPFWAHCAFETHCYGASAPIECGHHDEAPDGECPSEDSWHCHEHDIAPSLAKNVIPPLNGIDFPAWMLAALDAPAEPSATIIADARPPDESPPPHLIFAVAALPVRGPSLA